MKRYKIYVLGLLTVAMVFVLSGCSNKDEKDIEEGQYYLYYVDKAGTDLQTDIFTPKGEDDESIAEEMLDKLSSNTDDINMFRTIPDGVEINEFSINNKTAKIDFNTTYGTLDNVKGIICRSSIVLTLTQLAGINSVEFTLDGQPIVDSKGVIVGKLTSEDFVDTSVELVNAYSKVNITLYYANAEGDALKTYSYESVIANNVSVEKYIVEQLMAGPESDEYGKVISGDVELINVTTKDDICYVNFAEDFLTSSMDIKDELTIYSIVNSLAELDHITKVQILINGESDKLYHNNIDLSQALKRNLDYVEDAGVEVSDQEIETRNLDEEE